MQKKGELNKTLYKLLEVIKSKFISDSIATLIATLIAAVIGFVLNIVIAKLYSEKVLGVYTQVYSIYNILFFISLFGFNRTTIKYISENSKDKKKLSVIFFTSLINVTAIVMVILVVSYFVLTIFRSILEQRDLYEPLFLILYALPFYVINNILMCTLNGLRNMFSYSLLRLLRWVTLIVVILAISHIYIEYKNIFYSFVITEVFNLLVGIYLLRNELVKVDLKRIKIKTKELFKYSLNVFYSQFFNVLKERSDVLIIGVLTSNKIVGIYSLIVSTVRGLFLIGNVIQQNFNPIFVRKFKEKEKLDNYLRKLKKYSLIVFIPITIAMVVVYYLIVENILVGKEFNKYYLEFILMALGGYIFSVHIYAGGLLVMSGELISNTKRTFFVLASMILLTTTLTFYLDLLGAALAFVLLMLIEVLLLKYYTKKTIKISI